jgi:hypothetical protein
MIPTNIQTPEQLFPLAEAIHQFLKDKVNLDDINTIEDRGHELAAYMANTGKMLSDAKYWRDEALSDSILKRLNISLPASALNELVKAECKNENYMVNWIEQIDKECKYQLEWLRSCLSKAKEEMRLANYSTGNMS